MLTKRNPEFICIEGEMLTMQMNSDFMPAGVNSKNTSVNKAQRPLKLGRLSEGRA